MKNFFQAVAYSWRAGVTHKAFAWCEHRHRFFGTAYECARRQPRLVGARSRRWTVAEIVMVRELVR